MKGKGKVKWFDAAKGYGFIQSEDGEEVYVHRNDIANNEELKEGQAVEFEVGEGKRGKVATNVAPK